jgi:hypothetical protein
MDERHVNELLARELKDFHGLYFRKGKMMKQDLIESHAYSVKGMSSGK